MISWNVDYTLELICIEALIWCGWNGNIFLSSDLLAI